MDTTTIPSSSDEQPSSTEQVQAAEPMPSVIPSTSGRSFGDVLRDIVAALKLKSTATQAVQELQTHIKDRAAEVLQSPAPGLLWDLIKSGPGLPAAGTAMGVLAALALTAQGRAQLRMQASTQSGTPGAAITPVIRFLSLGDTSKPNMAPALLLTTNLAPDKLWRQAMRRACLVEALVALVQVPMLPLKQLEAVAGALLNVVAPEEGAGDARQRFVDAGGLEAVCRVLHERGRRDTSPAAVRLRLLLAEVGRAKGGQFEEQVRNAALEFSPAANLGTLLAGLARSSGSGGTLSAGGTPRSDLGPAASQGSLGSGAGCGSGAETGRGGTPRMGAGGAGVHGPSRLGTPRMGEGMLQGQAAA